MNLSIKVKFYIFVLPIIIVLPILLFSFVAPYSQLQEAFRKFEVDQAQAVSAEEFLGALDTQQLELFHLLLDIHNNSEGEDMYEEAILSVGEKFQTIKSQIPVGSNGDSESEELIDEIESSLVKFQTLAKQAQSLHSSGKDEEALDFVGDQLDPLLDEKITPAVEKLVLLKEDEVKTNLPFLTKTLSRKGVFSVPGIQQEIDDMLVHFENSIEAAKVLDTLDDLQSEYFDQVIQHKEFASIAGEDNHGQKAQEVSLRVPTLLAQMRERLDAANPEDADEVALIDSIVEGYDKLAVLNNKALSLSESGGKKEALDMLKTKVYQFTENTLDPLTEALISGDKEDVENSINNLSDEIDTITFYIYLVCALFLLGGIISIWKLSRDIINPIIILRKATLDLASGNFQTKVEIKSKDEFGDLANGFNAMAEKLQESYRTLEEKVKEQTAKLSNQIEELESAKKGMLNLMEDLQTEKVNIQKSQAKDEAILASIGDGIAVADEGGKLIYLNKIAEDILGDSANEATPASWQEKYGVFDAVTLKPYPADQMPLLLATKGKIITKTTMLIRNDKHPDGVFIQVTATPITLNEKSIGGVAIFRDMSKEQEVDKQKSEFVSLASHQLKTPVGAVRWNLEMLIDGDYGKISAKQKAILQESYLMNNRMNELINALLNVSRLEMGVFIIEPTPTDFKELCEEVIVEMKPRLVEKKHTLVKTFDKKLPVVSGDQKLLRILFQNFISNAIKYTPSQGKISVSLSATDTDIVFSVANSGDPIPQTDQPKIFQKMFRASNAQEQDPDGNGLGLYIVKQIVENAGGKVWFTSKSGEDTVFSCSFPLSGMKSKEGTKKLS